MIVVQDKIEIDGRRLDQVMQLFRDEYMEHAALRGLQFIESLISPPVKLQNAPNTLWLRWQVADAGAWWAMRAQSGDPVISQFWAKVDSLCIARERSYLSESAATALPQPTDVGEFIVTTQGYRETAQLSLRDSISAEQRSELDTVLRESAAELPGLDAASLSANFAPEYAAGHYTWDLLYRNRASAGQAQQSAVWQSAIKDAITRYCKACHALGLDTISAGVRQAELTNGIKRTAYFRLLPGTSDDTARRFEQDLLEMTGHIPQILNWRLSRASVLPWNTARCESWTYVWEQEYETLEDLLGPYMMHPHHWAHIDRWFDPESGVQAVDVQLSHAFCPLDRSIISLDTQ
ncbi:MAG: Dabb family protein [Halioglobus sp.]